MAAEIWSIQALMASAENAPRLSTGPLKMPSICVLNPSDRSKLVAFHSFPAVSVKEKFSNALKSSPSSSLKLPDRRCISSPTLEKFARSSTWS